MLSIIIPAFNEAENISKVLQKIEKLMKRMNKNYALIVIDDGSTDNTKQLLKGFKKNMYLISHEKNKGVAEVFKTAFNSIEPKLKENDLVVTLEADLTSDLKDLPEMIAKAEQEADVVLASCYAPGGSIKNISFERRFLSTGANTLMKMVFPMQGIHTYSSFFRVYRGSAIKKAIKNYGKHLIEEEGFTCVVELLIKMNRLGLRFAEVPTTLDLSVRKGRSKMNVPKTIAAYLKLIHRYAWKRG